MLFLRTWTVTLSCSLAFWTALVVVVPGSAYQLAQIRLKALEPPAK